METGLADIDGRAIQVGDKCRPVRGPYSKDQYKDLTAQLVWRSPMLSWLWSDGYLNPYPVTAPQNFRVIDPGV